MFQGTYTKIIFSIILLTVAVYVLIELAHHSSDHPHLLYGQLYYRNRQKPNLPSGVVSSQDLSPYDKKQPNFSPLGVKVTYKQQSNLPSEGADFHNKQQSNVPSRKVGPPEEVNLHDKHQSTSDEVNLNKQQPSEVNLHDNQQPNLPSREVEFHDKRQPPKKVNPHDNHQSTSDEVNLNKQQPSEVNLHDNQQPNLPSREVEFHDKRQPPKKVNPHDNHQSTSDEVNLNKQQPSEVNLHDNQQPNLPSREVEFHDKQQPPKQVNLHNKPQSNQPPKEVKDRNDQQQQLSTIGASVAEINQHLVFLGKSVNFEVPKTLTNVRRYVARLSSSQVNDTVAQMVEVSSLTSRVAQEQFLTCTGLVMLKNSKTLQPKSSISMPPSHQHCKTMSFKSSGPTVALVSYPGSGNSWVRQLLEASTGIYTGAVYCDSSYINVGMIGEGVKTNNVIAVKGHQDPPLIRKLINNNKAIYIVRNPFDAILSEYNRAIAVSSKKYASLGDSHTLEVDVNYGMYWYTVSWCLNIITVCTCSIVHGMSFMIFSWFH